MRKGCGLGERLQRETLPPTLESLFPSFHLLSASLPLPIPSSLALLSPSRFSLAPSLLPPLPSSPPFLPSSPPSPFSLSFLPPSSFMVPDEPILRFHQIPRIPKSRESGGERREEVSEVLGMGQDLRPGNNWSGSGSGSGSIERNPLSRLEAVCAASTAASSSLSFPVPSLPLSSPSSARCSPVRQRQIP